MKSDNFKRILYTAPRGIGDIMFSLPLLHSLKVAYPESEIYVPIPKDKKNVLDLVGFLNSTKRFMPKPSEDPLARERWQASVKGDVREKYRLEKLIYEKYLEGEEFDLAIIPKDFTIANIRCSTQVCEQDLRRQGIEIDGVHMVDRFLGFTDFLGIDRKMCFDLSVNKEDEIRLISGWKIESDKPYIVLNLGASLSKKVWSDKGYDKTASWCLDNGLRVILIGDKDCYERSLGIQGSKKLLNTVLKQGYSFDLGNFALLASRAEVVVSSDTGMLHVADAMGAKVIGLYGPTSPVKYAPYNNRDNVISRYNQDQNVQNISAGEVIEKIKEVIKR